MIISPGHGAKSVCAGDYLESPEHTVCVGQRCGWHRLFGESLSGSTRSTPFHTKGGFGAGITGARFPWSCCRTSFPTGQTGGVANLSVPWGWHLVSAQGILCGALKPTAFGCVWGNDPREPRALCKSSLTPALQALSPWWH